MKHSFLLISLLLALISSSVYSAPKELNCKPDFAKLEKSEEPYFSNIAELREKYAVFSEITEIDNRQFMQIADATNLGEAIPDGIFFDLENAVLKELNDKVVNDKGLVTSIVNFHKTLFWNEIKKDPELLNSIKAKYSDPKSIRIFSTNEANRSKILLAYENAGIKFEHALSALSEANSWKAASRGISTRFFNWHLAGLGKTPDEAGYAARYARTHTLLQANAKVHSFSDIANEAQRDAESVEELRKSVELLFNKIPGVMIKSPKGNFVLSTNAIEAIRKISPANPTLDAYIDSLRDSFFARYKYKLNNDEAVILRNYLSAADAFSPGIYIEKRVVIDVKKAELGIVSADFRGQNAQNIHETMMALADSTNEDIHTILHKVRLGEKRSTAVLTKAKAEFYKVVNKNHPGETMFTGDDGMNFPSAVLNKAEKKKIVGDISKRVERNLRAVFVPSNYLDTKAIISDAQRWNYISQGEDLEKYLRKKLLALVGAKEIDSTMIAIDILPKETNFQIGILLKRKDGRIPSAKLRRAVERLVQQKGLTLKYMH